ncbi:MAG TPA: hypothetical protein VN420_00605 [Candidatus Fimivivens sp.]|nr:hypothetical protein [Candidatus Fimivivens sp.]
MTGIPEIVSVAHAAGVIEDAVPIQKVLANALSLVLGAAGVLGLLSFVVSGILYLVSSGDEERARQAKRAMAYSVVGALVCLSSLLIIRTVVGMV